jgi:hypothetical protein
MTFSVFGLQQGPKIEHRATVSIAASCKKCSLPVLIVFRASDGSRDSQGFTEFAKSCLQRSASFDDGKFEPLYKWPRAVGPVVPEDLPTEVQKAFLQGEKNFGLPECEEAAVMMYRRSLEVALKIAYPELNGTLAKRIKSLVEGHHLPAAIGEWLDQVRLIGNDGAHEITGVTRDELEAARGFVDTALRYIFTLPAQTARLRGEPPAVA